MLGKKTHLLAFIVQGSNIDGSQLQSGGRGLILTINQRETHLLSECSGIIYAFDTFCGQKYFYWNGVLNPNPSSWASQEKRISMSHLIEVHQTLLPDHWRLKLAGSFPLFFSFNFLISQFHEERGLCNAVRQQGRLK